MKIRYKQYISDLNAFYLFAVPIVQICLPQNDSEIAMGNTGIVAGWSDNGKLLFYYFYLSTNVLMNIFCRNFQCCQFYGALYKPTRTK